MLSYCVSLDLDESKLLMLAGHSEQGAALALLCRAPFAKGL